MTWTCPRCGGHAVQTVDIMDSSWVLWDQQCLACGFQGNDLLFISDIVSSLKRSLAQSYVSFFNVYMVHPA